MRRFALLAAAFLLRAAVVTARRITVRTLSKNLPPSSLTVYPNNVLKVEDGGGDSAIVTVKTLSLQGIVDLTIGDGIKTSPLLKVETDLSIDEANAHLVINGSAYAAGPGTIKLINYNTISGTFAPDKIMLKGFPAGFWYKLVYEDRSIDLVIKPLRGPNYKDDYPTQPASINFPNFSWDKVPRWINVRKTRAFKDKELISISKNQLVVLGHNTAQFRTIEEGVVDTATKLKALNPNIKTLFYWNSQILWGPYGARDTFDNANWIKNYKKGAKGRKEYNLSVPEMRKWWVGVAVSMASSDAIDGVFIDKCSWRGRTLPPSTDHYSMIEDLQRTLPSNKLIIGNTLRQTADHGQRAYLPLTDGSYMENWDRSRRRQKKADALAASVRLAREALSKGKILLWNSGPWDCGHPCHKTQQEMANMIDMPLAIFLMVAERNAFLNYQMRPTLLRKPWEWDSSDLPQFQNQLGDPLGPPLQVGHVFIRSFEHLDVTVDLKMETATFRWKRITTSGRQRGNTDDVATTDDVSQPVREESGRGYRKERVGNRRKERRDKRKKERSDKKR